MSSVPMNKEQAVEMARQSWDTTKENVAMLKDAGLFKLEYVMAFSKEMALPFDKENFSVSAIQSLLLAKMGDAQLEKGFTIMNAVAFILEVCGDLFALLFDRSLVLQPHELASFATFPMNSIGLQTYVELADRQQRGMLKVPP